MLFQRFQRLLNERTKGRAAPNLRLDDGAPDEEVQKIEFLCGVATYKRADKVL